MILLGAVVVPASFVLAAIALFCRHRLAYAAGTLATLVAWPCVALIAAELQSFAVAYRLATLGCILSLLAFSIACFSVFLKPTVGYYAGLLAALLGWPFFVLREMNYPYHGNSWLWFNVPDYPRFSNEHTYVQLTVWAIVLLIFCTVTSFLRLSPASWVIRGTPIRDRTWPVFAASFVIVAAWFMRSATPYRVPMEASQLSADITVAHVEKYGFSFHETRVYLLRDGQFYISYDYRKPFQYRSQGTSFSGVVSQDAWDKARRLMSSPAFTALGNPRENVPPNWNSDTWYVRGERLPLVAFSTSNKTIPPQELVDWFHEMRNLPKTQGWHFVTKDICLSFCYEPSR